MAAPAGWYDDGHGRKRWWDGAQWTDRFQDQEQLPVTVAAEVVTTPVEVATVPPGWYPNASGAKEWWDGTKWTGTFESLRDQKRSVKANEKTQREVERTVVHTQQDIARLQGEKSQLEQQIVTLRSEVIDLESVVNLQDLGLYDYENPAQSSAELSGHLEAVRLAIKQTVINKTATTAAPKFLFNNSEAQGRKFVASMTAILLRAYNAEAENCVKTMRAGNLETAKSRLSKAAEQIAKQGAMIQLAINPGYHKLRVQELETTARYLQQLQTEKEAERDERARLRDQAKAESELRAERARLDKERAQYASTLEALQAKGDLVGVARMQERLADVDKAIENVDYRVANIRAGYVYVISNKGAFGSRMVKIGMTRRLEPMDRVNELGDASVPFRFDVHALFFADDAVAIESMLHQTFSEVRVNRVNNRREFFYVTPQEVLEALKQHNVEVVSFDLDAESDEYRVSRAQQASLDGQAAIATMPAAASSSAQADSSATTTLAASQ
jgi:hypothetical protein